MANKKGHKKRGVPTGNENGAKGPRIGRKDKPMTKNVAAPALPQPRSGAKLPQSARRAKTGGEDFKPGTNSHDGTVFRRGADQLPRGNMILHAKCVFHAN